MANATHVEHNCDDGEGATGGSVVASVSPLVFCYMWSPFLSQTVNKY